MACLPLLVRFDGSRPSTRASGAVVWAPAPAALSDVCDMKEQIADETNLVTTPDECPTASSAPGCTLLDASRPATPSLQNGVRV